MDRYAPWRDSPELCASLSRLINDPIFLRAKNDVIGAAKPAGKLDWMNATTSPDDALKSSGIRHIWLTGFMAAFRAMEELALIGQAGDGETSGGLPDPFTYMEEEIEE